MKRIRYTLTSHSPLLLSTGSEDANATSSLDHIPGRVMQGILAHYWIKKSQLSQAHEDTDFYNCILNGELIFTPAYLKDEYSKQRSYPLPLSIQKDKDSQNVLDVLVKKTKPGQITKPVARLGYIQGEYITPCSPTLSLHFHHNSQYGERDPLPFTYEALDAAQAFEGFIIGSDAALGHVQRYLEDQQRVYVGRSRSAQYGKATLALSAPESFSNDADTESSSFKDLVYLSCLSDVLLYDEYGNPSTQIKDLERYLGAGVKVQQAMMRTTLYESYQGNWNLRRPDELCIQAGSTFVLKLPDEGQHQKTLQDFMQTGLGERTNEGLGRVVFGLQGNVTYKLTALKSGKTLALPEKCPKLAGDLLEKILLKKVERACFEMVIEEALTLREPRLPKSLLSRLDSYLQIHSVDQFQKFVSDLKGKPAGDKLDGLKFKKYKASGPGSLFEWLKKDPVLDALADEKQPYIELAQQLKINLPQWIKQHKEDLSKLYYQSLLHQLKSTIKLNDKNKAQEA